MTQPLGHTTSGSHERYKSKERLDWEMENDCLKKMREWILENEIAHQGQLDAIETEASKMAREAKNKAWIEFIKVLKKDKKEAVSLLDKLNAELGPSEQLTKFREGLEAMPHPLKLETIKPLKYALRYTRNQTSPSGRKLMNGSK